MAKQIEGVYDAVLACAKEEFLDKGYQEASLRTIAQKAGTSTGSIYTRFGVRSPEPEVSCKLISCLPGKGRPFSSEGCRIGPPRNDSDTRGCGCSGDHGYLKACWPEKSTTGR